MIKIFQERSVLFLWRLEYVIVENVIIQIYEDQGKVMEWQKMLAWSSNSSEDYVPMIYQRFEAHGFLSKNKNVGPPQKVQIT